MLHVWSDVYGCLMLFLPCGRGDKISIQQPQLAEQNSVDKRHSGQLLQGQMRLELEFLLFYEEGHCFSVFTRIKTRTKPNKTLQ